MPPPDELDEPVYCGFYLYGSDVGVYGYDQNGPAYTHPACPVHGDAHAQAKAHGENDAALPPR